MQLAAKDQNPDGKIEHPQLTYCTNIHAGESWPQHLPLHSSESDYV